MEQVNNLQNLNIKVLLIFEGHPDINKELTD